MFKPSDRIADFKPYFFVTLNQQIAQVRSRGVDVIRLDMGSPDLAPRPGIIEVLRNQALRMDTHAYAPSGGSREYREAVAAYYRRRFGVELDPVREVQALIGSKEGLFALSQVILNPGDVSLVPDPGYPVYSASGKIAGAEIVALPLREANEYLPDLTAIPADKLRRAKLIWVNYPNNPTGAVAGDRFYRELVEFAHRNHLLIAHDLAYADLTFDGYRAPSILQYEGAQEVAVEFYSLSKSYNMAGWRLGAAVGNPQILEYLETYKSQQDTSHFLPILSAGAEALNGDQTWLEDRNRIYQRRRDIIVNALRNAGVEVQMPKAAIYVWAKVPTDENSQRFCSRLLEQTGVSTTPGSVYGSHGEGFFRISLCIPEGACAEAMVRFSRWINQN